jgi:LEA14-like dessication related protein
LPGEADEYNRLRKSEENLMSIRHRSLALTLLVLLLVGCATQGSSVPTPPSVRFTQFDSLVFTPEVIKFQVRLLIRNRMRAGLDLQKIDYGVNLHDKPLFTDSFAELYPIKGDGQEVVTFPFQIAMKDIAKQAVDVLAEEALRVSFQGQVYPVGFDPVPFESTRTIPLPKIPSVAVEGTRGSPAERIFTVLLRITNPNTFALNLKSIDSYLEINGTKYGLLRTQGTTEIQPNSAETVSLSMEQSTAKTLSMVLNMAQSGSFRFAVGGDLRCQTPYGLIFIPLKLNAERTL